MLLPLLDAFRDLNMGLIKTIIKYDISFIFSCKHGHETASLYCILKAN